MNKNTVYSMQRAPLTDTLATALVGRVRDAILDGTLPDGERVNEVHLAERLGVSRTPLREALNRLVSDGLLTLRARHGYSVPALTLAAFEAEYGVRPILDVAALELQGLPAPDALADLEELNNRFLQAATLEARIDADEAFHLKLVGDCGNPVLLDLIRTMMLRTRRYEYAYFREARAFGAATDEHARILEALQARDLSGACAALRDNLTSGLDPLRDWLTSRLTFSKG